MCIGYCISCCAVPMAIGYFFLPDCLLFRFGGLVLNDQYLFRIVFSLG